MANQEAKLYGVSASPFSRRVETVLKMKGVEYENIEENLSNKSPELLKYNPIHKKIPAFVHNGKPIAESLVILEYIDETWKSGKPILPEDPYERAMARFWAKFIDDKCVPAILKACRGQGEEKEKAFEETTEYLTILENEIKGKKFFGGESIGFVDIVANFIGLWLGVFQEIVEVKLLTKEKFPNLVRWSGEYLNDEIIKKSSPPRAELLARFQATFKPNK